MPNPTSRRPAGFTLVELLVVIAIIAVLASAGFGVGLGAIQRAKRATCLATCTALETAVNNFYTEYGYMPTDATEDTTVTTKSSDTKGVELLTILLGLEPATSATIKNPRSVKFLTVNEGKTNKNGLIYSPDGKTVKGLYDPWGGPYNVMMDCDYNETITPTLSAVVVIPQQLNGRRVAVWSNGADGVNGGGKSLDDVKTWK